MPPSTMCALARVDPKLVELITNFKTKRVTPETIELKLLLRLALFVEARPINVDLAMRADLPEKLSDLNPLIRWAAANQIAKKRIPAEKELIDRLNDPYLEIRQAAHQALMRIARGADLGPTFPDSEAKIKQATKRWNDWLTLQEPARATSSGSRTDGPSDTLQPREEKKSPGEKKPPKSIEEERP